MLYWLINTFVELWEKKSLFFRPLQKHLSSSTYSNETVLGKHLERPLIYAKKFFIKKTERLFMSQITVWADHCASAHINLGGSAITSLSVITVMTERVCESCVCTRSSLSMSVVPPQIAALINRVFNSNQGWRHDRQQAVCSQELSHTVKAN